MRRRTRFYDAATTGIFQCPTIDLLTPIARSSQDVYGRARVVSGVNCLIH